MSTSCAAAETLAEVCILMRGAGRGLPLRCCGSAVVGVQSERARRMAVLTAPQSSWWNGWAGGGCGGGCGGGLLAGSAVAGMPS